MQFSRNILAILFVLAATLQVATAVPVAEPEPVTGELSQRSTVSLSTALWPSNLAAELTERFRMKWRLRLVAVLVTTAPAGSAAALATTALDGSVAARVTTAPAGSGKTR